MAKPSEREVRRRYERGLTLFEVMVAAFLLLVVFFGLAQLYVRGRRQIDYEEDRRKATAVAQARLDGIRRDYKYDNLSTLDGTDTTYVVDGRTYTVSHWVATGTPEAEAATCSLRVVWTAKTYSGNVQRAVGATTILGRGMP